MTMTRGPLIVTRRNRVVEAEAMKARRQQRRSEQEKQSFASYVLPRAVVVEVVVRVRFVMLQQMELALRPKDAALLSA